MSRGGRGRQGGLVTVVVACGILLASCAEVGSLPGVVTVGDIRIVAFEPPNLLTCAIDPGYWVGISGVNFGGAGGQTVTFDPRGVPAQEVQLVEGTSGAELQQLNVQVPFNVAPGSGYMTIDAGANGWAQIPVMVSSSATCP